MDRAESLTRCLQSIVASETRPAQVVVSDDSRAPEVTRKLCDLYPFVQYVRGPQRGLCANRNQAIQACAGDYVALLDDDAALTPEFVRQAEHLAGTSDGKTIFTGRVWENGSPLPLRNPSFWGHFTGNRMVRHETIHLNCNLFPSLALSRASFDEKIVYGYEDMDLCSQLLAVGYRIEYRTELNTQHFPPPRDPAQWLHQTEQARYYTSLKRYLIIQRKPMTALAYLLLAPLHQALHHVKSRTWQQIPQVARDMSIALSYLKNEMKLREVYASQL